MRVLAVFASDIHLSHTPPIARSREPDWYTAMGRSLDELSALSSSYNVPVVIAGDLFDRWNPPPELINFAIDRLPSRVWAIAGNHDLPNHRHDEMARSAYGTLVMSGRIENLSGMRELAPDVRLHSFPFGEEITNPVPDPAFRDVVVAHAYVWKLHCKYPDAPQSSNILYRLQQVSSYQAAFFGDNHMGFIQGNLMNCGTFFRRRTDDIDYRPHVGLLRDDMTIEPHYLDTSLDVISDDHLVSRELPRGPRPDALIAELKELGDGSIDFREAVRVRLGNPQITDSVREIVLRSLPQK